MTSQLLPTTVPLLTRKRPSASAAWSFNFYLTPIRYSHRKRPSASAAWSLNFYLTPIRYSLERDHRLQPHDVSITTYHRSATHSKETIGFSRVEFQFLPNTNPLLTSKETIGFSRMESQFLPNTNPLLTRKRPSASAA